MKGILEILSEYEGGRLLFPLYLICLFYLAKCEKDRSRKILLLWLPLLCLVMFLLPPV